MDSRRLTVFPAPHSFYVMHGRHVYGVFATAGLANAAIAASGEPRRRLGQQHPDPGPEGAGAWEDEGGALGKEGARESAQRPAAGPSCFAMILCPDCLRTKPHWVTWHTGSCRVACQECGRLSEMDDGAQIHEAVSSRQ